jgi:hypothetical protein
MKSILILFSIFCLTTIANIVIAQEVKINSNLAVEADGTVRLDGDATVWDDLMVYPDATSRGSNNPPTFTLLKSSASQGVWIWGFSNSTEQEVFFTVQIPHKYKQGSDLHPHVHWTTFDGNSAPTRTNVVWGLEYTVVKIGGTFGTTSTITGNTVIPGIASVSGTSQHLITSLGTISGTNLEISTVLVCRLFRKVADASDTYSSSAGLLGFDIHYEIDTEGSREEYVK